MDQTKLYVDFVSAVKSSAVVQTFDAFNSSLLILPIIGVCVLILFYLMKRQKALETNIYGDYLGLTNKNNSFKNFIVVFFTLLLATFISTLFIGRIACAGINTLLVPSTDKVSASVYDDGSIEFSKCTLTNQYNDLVSLTSCKVEITDEAKSILALSNSNIKIQGYDGVIYDGLPDGLSHDIVNIKPVKTNEVTELTFSINNINYEIYNELIGKNVFVISITPKIEQSSNVEIDFSGVSGEIEPITGIHTGASFITSANTLTITDIDGHVVTRTVSPDSFHTGTAIWSPSSGIIDENTKIKVSFKEVEKFNITFSGVGCRVDPENIIGIHAGATFTSDGNTFTVVDLDQSKIYRSVEPGSGYGGTAVWTPAQGTIDKNINVDVVFESTETITLNITAEGCKDKIEPISDLHPGAKFSTSGLTLTVTDTDGRVITRTIEPDSLHTGDPVWTPESGTIEGTTTIKVKFPDYKSFNVALKNNGGDSTNGAWYTSFTGEGQAITGIVVQAGSKLRISGNALAYTKPDGSLDTVYAVVYTSVNDTNFEKAVASSESEVMDNNVFVTATFNIKVFDISLIKSGEREEYGTWTVDSASPTKPLPLKYGSKIIKDEEASDDTTQKFQVYYPQDTLIHTLIATAGTGDKVQVNLPSTIITSSFSITAIFETYYDTYTLISSDIDKGGWAQSSINVKSGTKIRVVEPTDNVLGKITYIGPDGSSMEVSTTVTDSSLYCGIKISVSVESKTITAYFDFKFYQVALYNNGGDSVNGGWYSSPSWEGRYEYIEVQAGSVLSISLGTLTYTNRAGETSYMYALVNRDVLDTEFIRADASTYSPIKQDGAYVTATFMIKEFELTLIKTGSKSSSGFWTVDGSSYTQPIKVKYGTSLVYDEISATDEIKKVFLYYLDDEPVHTLVATAASGDKVTLTMPTSPMLESESITAVFEDNSTTYYLDSSDPSKGNWENDHIDVKFGTTPEVNQPEGDNLGSISYTQVDGSSASIFTTVTDSTMYKGISIEGPDANNRFIASFGFKSYTVDLLNNGGDSVNGSWFTDTEKSEAKTSIEVQAGSMLQVTDNLLTYAKPSGEASYMYALPNKDVQDTDFVSAETSTSQPIKSEGHFVKATFSIKTFTITVDANNFSMGSWKVDGVTYTSRHDITGVKYGTTFSTPANLNDESISESDSVLNLLSNWVFENSSINESTHALAFSSSYSGSQTHQFYVDGGSNNVALSTLPSSVTSNLTITATFTEDWGDWKEIVSDGVLYFPVFNGQNKPEVTGVEFGYSFWSAPQVYSVDTMSWLGDKMRTQPGCTLYYRKKPGSDVKFYAVRAVSESFSDATGCDPIGGSHQVWTEYINKNKYAKTGDYWCGLKWTDDTQYTIWVSASTNTEVNIDAAYLAYKDSVFPSEYIWSCVSCEPPGPPPWFDDQYSNAWKINPSWTEGREWSSTWRHEPQSIVFGREF